MLEDGRVGFIDFGIVGVLSTTVRTAMTDLLQALVVDDFDGVARSLVMIGATSEGVDIDKFGKELRDVVDSIMKIQPDVVIQATTEGTVLGVWCRIANLSLAY